MKSSLIRLYKAKVPTDFEFIRKTRNYFVNRNIFIHDKIISTNEQKLWFSKLDHDINIHFIAQDIIANKKIGYTKLVIDKDSIQSAEIGVTIKNNLSEATALFHLTPFQHFTLKDFRPNPNSGC